MIVANLTAVLIRTNEVYCRVPMPAQLHYDAADPLAFDMLFWTSDDEEEGLRTWTASRDLLVDAMTSPDREQVGEGDVKFIRQDKAGRILVCLKSPEGHADIALPTQTVQSFLESSEDDAAEGVKSIHRLVDEAIEGILDGA